MSCFLALESSTDQGSLALMEYKKEKLNCLVFKDWKHQAKVLKNSHSDKLPLEIQKALKQGGKNLSDLEFLAVGMGPGRWTGVRTAVNVARAFSFALNIPIFPVNSLRISAEASLQKSSPVFVALNGFKNQIYFSEFFSLEDEQGNLKLLTFTDWCEVMKEKARLYKEKKPVCISDVESFYPLPKDLKNSFAFYKPEPSALGLSQIVSRKKTKALPWSKLKALYLRNP